MKTNLTRAFVGPLVLALALATGSGAAPAAAKETSQAPDMERAAAFVDQLAERAIENIATADIPQQERIKRFRHLLEHGFNIPLVSRLALGRYWRKADPDMRKRFSRVFETFTVYRYAGLFDKYKGQELEVVGVSEDGRKGALVTSKVKQPEGAPVTVRWRLRPAATEGPDKGGQDAGQKKPRWQVVDIVVEGVSMIITQRDEFSALARRKGVDGLVAALEAKVQDFQKQGPPAPPEVVKDDEG